jgi:Zn-dependent peptidase ImmA (M78 family)
MRGLARVEGGNADSDRLIEMRANAFAVELLLPMENLVDELGNFFQDDDLKRLAEQRHISFHALSAHADNLRQRLT